MSDHINAAHVSPAPSPFRRSMVTDVCLLLLVGCCLCASLAASLI